MRSFISFVLTALFLLAAPFQTTAAESSATDRYTFKRGVIINHWIADNVPASMMKNAHYGADWFDDEDVSWIADHGFDHLRIWVSGHEWVGTDGELIDGAIAPFEQALNDARGKGLGVVLTMHSLPRYRANIRGEGEPANAGTPFTNADVRAEAENLWAKVARRFKKYDAQLRFELSNQPDATDAKQIQTFNEIMLAAVRKSDEQRVVYLSGRDGSVESIEDAVLSDANTALALSFREPGIFAFQYREDIPKIMFPGIVPDLSMILETDHPWQKYSKKQLTIDDLSAKIRAIAEKAKRVAGKHEVYIHNIGAMIIRADEDSVRAYMRTIRDGLEREGLAWAVYDYHSGCAVRAQAGTGGPTAVLEGLDIASNKHIDANYTYKKGVIVTHWLGAVAPAFRGKSDTPHTYAASWFDEEDMEWIANHGFDHVQILVDADQWALKSGIMPEDKLAPFIYAMNQANQRGMGVVLTFAENPWQPKPKEFDTQKELQQIADQWAAITKRFMRNGEGLRFQFGESSAPLSAQPGGRFKRYMEQIRAHDSGRFVYLPTPSDDSEGVSQSPHQSNLLKTALGALDIERYDDRVGVSFGFWQPEVYSFQVPNQGLVVPFPGRVPDASKIKLNYPGDDYEPKLKAWAGRMLDVSIIKKDIDLIVNWSRSLKRPRELYMHEFGMVENNIAEHTRNYIGAIVDYARSNNIGWSIYDYESGRAIRDAEGNPTPAYEGLGLSIKTEATKSSPH